jgi:hypothetical protein
MHLIQNRFLKRAAMNIVINLWEFLDQISNYQLLKKRSAPWIHGVSYSHAEYFSAQHDIVPDSVVITSFLLKLLH